MKKTAIIALGSNLDNPLQQIQAALKQVAMLPETVLLQTSSYYQTAPVGYADQPDFINAVCLVETTLAADKLLTLLHEIEAAFGRKRTFRNAPRTLDLDLIDYDGMHIQSEHLVLPHPRARERAFVMVPLAEVAQDYRIGGAGETAAETAQHLPQDGIVKIQAA